MCRGQIAALPPNDMLYNAARNGDMDGVLHAVADGANNYNSGLIVASLYGYFEIARLMLQLGARNYQDAEIVAALHGYDDIVHLIRVWRYPCLLCTIL